MLAKNSIRQAYVLLRRPATGVGLKDRSGAAELYSRRPGPGIGHRSVYSVRPMPDGRERRPSRARAGSGGRLRAPGGPARRGRPYTIIWMERLGLGRVEGIGPVRPVVRALHQFEFQHRAVPPGVRTGSAWEE